MRYLAIGDGLCAGMGTPLLSPSFVYRHARQAEQILGEKVFVTNMAVVNNHTNDILQSLHQPVMKRNIQLSDMIVLSAGHQDLQTAKKKYDESGNEEEFLHELRMCKSQLDDIICYIRDMKKAHEGKYMLIILGLHNPYPDSPLAEKWIMCINRFIECRANHSYIKTVNLHDHFQNQLNSRFTRDNLYPNHIGHIEIANNLHELGYEPILEKQVKDE